MIQNLVRSEVGKMITAFLSALFIFSSFPMVGFAAESNVEENIQFVLNGGKIRNDYYVEPGSDIILSFDEGEEPEGMGLTYQWYFGTIEGDSAVIEDKEIIPGATDWEYVLHDIQKAKTGIYICEISDGVRTGEVHKGVYIDTKLSHDKENNLQFSEVIKKDFVEMDESITLSFNATNIDPNTYPITYQWYKALWNPISGKFEDYTLVENATSNTYTIDQLTDETIGRYRCLITDGQREAFYEAWIMWDTGLAWKIQPQDVYANLGDRVELGAEAVSKAGAVTYLWSRAGEPIGEETDDPSLVFESLEEDDFGFYTCTASDGYNTIKMEINISPKTDLVLNMDDFQVVSGETIEITGKATMSKLGNSERDFMNISWAKYTPYIGDDGDVHNGVEMWWENSGEFLDGGTDYNDPNVLGGKAYAKMEYTETQDTITGTFRITIKDITPDMAGEYVVAVSNGYENVYYQQFTISVSDEGYVYMELVGEGGYGLTGALSPGAELWVVPVEDENILAQFESELNSEQSILLARDISLRVDGFAAAFQGELELSIPVGNVYNGQTMLVLHGTSEGIEHLNGQVEDGNLKITTDSLSPFAVIIERDNEDVPGEPDEPIIKDPGTSNEGNDDTTLETVTDVPQTGEKLLTPWFFFVITIALGGAMIALALLKSREYKR